MGKMSEPVVLKKRGGISYQGDFPSGAPLYNIVPAIEGSGCTRKVSAGIGGRKSGKGAKRRETPTGPGGTGSQGQAVEVALQRQLTAQQEGRQAGRGVRMGERKRERERRERGTEGKIIKNNKTLLRREPLVYT